MNLSFIPYLSLEDVVTSCSVLMLVDELAYLGLHITIETIRFAIINKMLKILLLIKLLQDEIFIWNIEDSFSM